MTAGELLSPFSTGWVQSTAPLDASTAYTVPPEPAPPVYTTPAANVGGEVKEYWPGSVTVQTFAPVAGSNAVSTPSLFWA